MTDGNFDQRSRAGRREERRKARASRREERWGKGGAWVGGVILIALGVVFLLQNFGFPVPKNWWAIFIMVPGIAALGAAWSLHERAGAWTSGAVGSLLAGSIIVGMAIVFFFGFDLGKFWPLILVALGVAALSGAGWPRRRSGE